MAAFLKGNLIARSALLVAIFFIPALADAAPGDLDPAFGTNGSATIPLGRQLNTPNGIVAQGDGKYLVSTSFGRIVRFNVDRTPDLTRGFKGVAGDSFVSGLTLSGGVVIAIVNVGGLGDGGNAPARQYQLTHVSRFTTGGLLDTTFGSGQTGRTTAFPAGGTDSTQRYNAVAIAPDGKIVVAGESSGSVLVVRYSAAGVLDTSFGTGGWTRFTVGAGGNEGYGVAVQADGKVIVAGNYGTVLSGFVARLSDAGALDTTFNSTGTYLLSTAAGPTDCRSVLLDGTRIVVGCSQTSGGVKHFLLLGLTNAGAVDTGFDSTLKDAGGPNDMLSGIVKHPDGRIFAVGRGGAGSNRIAIVAVNANGTLATAFASGGVYTAPETEPSDGRAIGWNGSELVVAGFRTVTTDDDAVLATFTSAGVRASVNYSNLLYSYGRYWRVKALPNGQILAAGNTTLNGQSNFLVSRLNANGALDTSFGSSGHSTLSTVDIESFGLRDFALQGDGKIVMTGDFGRGNPDVQSVGAARTLANGGADVSFNATGTPGQNYLSIPNTINAATGRAIRVQSDGKILVVSRFASSVDSSAAGRQALIVRFNTNGSVDSTYGINGVAKTAFTSATQSRAMDLDAAGRAILTGDGSGQVRLARFTTSGFLDSTFGIGGMASFSMPAGVTLRFTAAKTIVLPTGKILAMLHASTATDGVVGLMRANPDGSLDTTFGTAGFSFAVASAGNINGGSAFEMVVAPNGRIVLAGGSQSGNNFIGLLVRFLPHGALDSGFGSRGARLYPEMVEVLGVDTLNDGSLVLSGATGSGQSFGFVLKTLPDLTATTLSLKTIAPLLLLLLD